MLCKSEPEIACIVQNKLNQLILKGCAKLTSPEQRFFLMTSQPSNRHLSKHVEFLQTPGVPYGSIIGP